MAPKLSRAQHEVLEGMITAGFTNKSIAKQVGCSSRSVSRIRSNLRMFESTKAPPNRVGRRCKIDPLVQDDLLDQLVKEPTMSRSEMIAFIRNKYELDVSLSTITRLLQAAGWTRKNGNRVEVLYSGTHCCAT
ncbi:transcriptional regulator family: Bacterial regulatory protein, LuxR [Purpureocillium lilacinum]|uniref:Transcriptional regulator family: Bacterial regulatory protein, LuxR n=1 Tax=Purpureocillium lilacinum TaxID=33203 RepID=A0ABR0BFG1_PURLI|nr:transcriptional regulator family: Bacterial regulatory protein, LuxR [Purpureocillium lilacinum]